MFSTLDALKKMTIILFDFSWGDHFRTIAEIVVVYSGQSSNFYIVNTHSEYRVIR